MGWLGFLSGCGLGILAAYLLGLVIPMQVFQIVCLVLMASGASFVLSVPSWHPGFSGVLGVWHAEASYCLDPVFTRGVLSGTAVSTRAAPLFALALPEGRTYDQAHNTGYIDWSGPVQYVYVQHRDMTSLPPEEGGTHCGSGCWEWVTRLGNGGVASGSFDRDVSYFEVMVGFTPDPNTGNATLRACSAVKTWNLQVGSGLPGFVSMDLAVPAGCRTWSLTASGGYVDFRSIDVYYIGPPSTPTPYIRSRTTHDFTPTYVT